MRGAAAVPTRRWWSTWGSVSTATPRARSESVADACPDMLAEREEQRRRAWRAREPNGSSNEARKWVQKCVGQRARSAARVADVMARSQSYRNPPAAGESAVHSARKSGDKMMSDFGFTFPQPVVRHVRPNPSRAPKGPYITRSFIKQPLF